LVKRLAWSPDGKSIAAIITTGGENDELLIIPVSNNTAGARRIPLHGSFQAFNRYRLLTWCPSSDCIAVQLANRKLGVFWREGNRGPAMHSGELEGFVDDRRMLFTTTGGLPNFGDSGQATIQDLENGAGGVPSFYSRSVDYVEAFGPPARALVHFYGKDTEVLDPINGTVLCRGLTLPNHNIQSRFGDHGRVVCIGGDSEGWGSEPVLCYDTTTGSETLPRPKVRNGSPLDMAREAPVLLASDIYSPHTLINFFKFLAENEGEVAKSLVFWDLGKGREIARIKYPMQAVKTDFETIGRSAISPNGKEFAIGADDFLRIYRL
jgi:hypothetical protein